MLKFARSIVVFVILPLATLVSLSGAKKATPPVADSAKLTAWMKKNAHPFATCIPGDTLQDLASLRQIVGDARIVALGEGTHGTREFFQLKHRIVQYLATEMGFNVFAIEANLPEAWRINDYVLGGPGNPKELICGMHFWTWNTQEVLDMIEWMRAFNASGRGRIEFTGFDMQNPDTAAAIVNRYLAAHDPGWADTVNALLRFTPKPMSFVTATGTLPVADFAGHHVRYSGFIRTKDVSLYAGLWMRADTPDSVGAFDNMADQEIKGTKDWNRYTFDLDIPKNTNNINFGVLMASEGDAWFDSLTVLVDGKPWRNADFDLDLDDAEGPKGLGQYAASGYSIAMDDAVAKTGKRSLHLSGSPVAHRSLRLSGTPPATMNPEPMAHRLIDHLEASRGNMGTPTEADWIIRNAQVLLQRTLLVSGNNTGAVRDSSMAANFEWIADLARPGSKIVIWAHNGHINKRRLSMGGYLAEHYGPQFVALGFTANVGTYTALQSGRELSSENQLKPGPAGSFEAIAAATHVPRFLIDLRTAQKTPDVDTAFKSQMTMRSIGAVAMNDQFFPAPISDYFDAIAWVAETKASQCFGFCQ